LPVGGVPEDMLFPGLSFLSDANISLSGIHYYNSPPKDVLILSSGNDYSLLTTVSV